jgi:hypothetical protein
MVPSIRAHARARVVVSIGNFQEFSHSANKKKFQLHIYPLVGKKIFSIKIPSGEKLFLLGILWKKKKGEH